MATLSPLLYAALAHIICGVNLSYTTNHNIRFISGILLTCLVALGITVLDRSVWYSDSFIMYMIGFILHSTNYLCLNPVYPPKEYLTSNIKRGWWGLQALFSPRFLPRTRNAITAKKDDDSVEKKKEQGEEPSRYKFLLQHILVVVIAYQLDKQRNKLPNDVDYVDIIYPKEQFFRRLPDVTLKDLKVRLYMVLYSLGGTWCDFNLAHSACALVAVGIFNDTVSNWPPLFGSVRDAYTMRRFWSIFWHRLMRKPFVAHSIYIINHIPILRASSDPLLRQQMVLFMVFAISGVMHSFVETSAWKCANLRQVWYSLGLAFTIFIEDRFRSYYNKWRETRTGEPQTRSVQTTQRDDAIWWEKAVGYIWVLSWYMWAMPKTSFPAMRCY